VEPRAWFAAVHKSGSVHIPAVRCDAISSYLADILGFDPGQALKRLPAVRSRYEEKNALPLPIDYQQQQAPLE
jgi:hypothetical protein